MRDVRVSLTKDSADGAPVTRAEVDQDRAEAVAGLRKTPLGFAVWQADDGVECSVITDGATLGEIAHFLVAVMLLHQDVTRIFVAKMGDELQAEMAPTCDVCGKDAADHMIGCPKLDEPR